ncbi:hypothetical protein QEH52_01780 [Coraliomargarita sp. SDUM461003]|uniref:Uncharacterized protein n=1 Tax=Thalassobacterium maritimum TaxID=3041265 RepID=A0ABU1ARH8_9BACT|nr:hypothetical protein [Coraliomargarita sp. SDUM461003]MDQ8206222.1 hypothetical protein [Coraliomargarita sp. SDUM461003]
MTPSRKIEKALCADVLTVANIPELSLLQRGSVLNVYPGLNYETKHLPRMQVAMPDVSPAPGFEGVPDAREYVGDLYIAVLSDAQRADDAVCDAYDGLIGAVQALFEGSRSDISLAGLLNYPESGPDERTVKELYIYQARFEGESQDHLERGVWQVLLHYQVEFTVHDGQPAE